MIRYFSENIRASLQTALGEGSAAPKFQLSAEDYEHRETHILNSQQEGVRFKVYAPAVFATIRTAFGVGRREFLSSVAPPPDLSYLRYSWHKRRCWGGCAIRQQC